MERKVRELNDNAKAELQESIDISRAEIKRLDSIVTQFRAQSGLRGRNCIPKA
jgi:hypothetical protein